MKQSRENRLRMTKLQAIQETYNSIMQRLAMGDKTVSDGEIRYCKRLFEYAMNKKREEEAKNEAEA